MSVLRGLAPPVRSIVPALLTLTRPPGTTVVTADCPPPFQTSVLVESISNRPVCAVALPNDTPRSSSEIRLPFVSAMLSQFVKRLSPLVCVWSNVRALCAVPPSNADNPARLASFKFDNVAATQPAPNDTVPPITPPPSHPKVVAPSPDAMPCAIDPPVTAIVFAPPPSVTAPPIVPPDKVKLVVPEPAVRLVSICPPDMAKAFWAAVIATLPMRPPVIVTAPPFVRSPVTRPPFSVKRG